jgi:hypothetical protein
MSWEIKKTVSSDDKAGIFIIKEERNKRCQKKY